MAHHAPSADAPHAHDDHGPMHYVKIWALLLVLFAISVAGPMLEVRILTIITAFGIAFVKAAIVCAYFMHLKIEKRFVHYLLYTMLLAVGMFFLGVMTDIMKPRGANWENVAAQKLIEEHKANPNASHPGHSDAKDEKHP